jgi:ATP-binding cassette subfamily B protein
MARIFPFYKQHDAMDCGATCLRMIARHYGRFFSLDYLRTLTHQRREGVSLLEISDAAEHLGFRTLAAKIDFERLRLDVPLPCVVHWRQNHYLVVYRITRRHVQLADPAVGLLRLTHQEFMDGWLSITEEGEKLGVVLVVEPTSDFFQQDDVKVNKGSFSYLFSYLFRYKNLLWQLILGLIITVVLQLVFPFLIQSLVDEGINSLDFSFVMLILLAWSVLLFSQVLIEQIRAWILLHLGVRANVNLISDFLIKIVRLPIRFFDQKMTSDLLKRIYDNERVERLLTTSSILSLFSAVSIVLLSLVLLYFDLTVFLIFIVATLIYVLWVFRFMRARRELDYLRFDQASENQGKLIELISGMQDIKLNNAETRKRWEWERSEAKLFRSGMNYLRVNQRQQLGARIINDLKNILIIVFSAKAVISGSMTIGVLVAIQYILGQVNAPLSRLIEFFRAAQDAKISLERMNEVHLREEEEDLENRISLLPEHGDLKLENVSFRYGGAGTPEVLKNIHLTIPQGKTTAIVGSSGSGKTTLLKLLLNIYQPNSGTIKVGDVSLNNIQNRVWRAKCGAVLQDGYIFSDTIARNIGLGDDIIDDFKLINAAKQANIQRFIESLAMGYNTRIGAEGIGLSAGQRQRILIARAIYKNPDYFFLDEATNALDAYNEMLIMENLEDHFRGKTVVLIAHRLSTVINADHILVLEEGEIIEEGTHESLTAKRGAYFSLLRNQLELGG